MKRGGRERESKTKDLRREDNGVSVEEQREVARQIKRPRQPPPRRDVQHPAPVGPELRQAVDGVSERPGVGRDAVPHPPEVRQRRRVGPAAGSHVLETACGGPTTSAPHPADVASACDDGAGAEERRCPQNEDLIEREKLISVIFLNLKKII